jgi:serine/threonine protein kinase
MESKPVERATDRYLATSLPTPGQSFVVDWLPWTEPSDDVATRVSRSSGLLADVQRPELLLLPCAGYLEEFSKRRDQVRYALAYKLPLDPIAAATSLLSTQLPKIHSLRQLLQPKQNVLPPPLDARLDLARKLCRAILLYHSSGWIHHDLRLHNILFLQPPPVTTKITSRTSPSSLAATTAYYYYQGVRLDKPYIVGFGHARDEEDTFISTALDLKSLSPTLAQQRLY